MLVNWNKPNDWANKDCPKCSGNGTYQYTSRGTPQFAICDLCCKHDKDRWLLTEPYSGYRKGKETWCCGAGCGKTWDKEKDG